jgi:NAD(P)-dependent dehydrogenase (short-subunit alcohol dehydrogenase family)
VTKTVVITGASRGLGLASASYLYQQGFRIVAAMRSVEAGLERLRSETSAQRDDPRLLGVPLDLENAESIERCAQAILEQVGPPDVLVHNAGVAAAGTFEDTPESAWQVVFATNVFGPIALTRALLPAMRSAGRGRIVVISSQGAVRGMPVISAYSASKGAIERWGESLAVEIAPFGLSLSVIVPGTFKTDILVQTADYRNYSGPYAKHYLGMDKTGELVVGAANPPERFARVLAETILSDAPFSRRAAGVDAWLMTLASKSMPGWLLHRVVSLAMRLPRAGALRPPSAALAHETLEANP